MADNILKKSRISGVCCALPKNKRTILEVGEKYFAEEDIKKTASPIGVEYIYTVSEKQNASDLCFAAAEKLISGLDWEKEEIDGLLFISQTPDYLMPATSGILQDRLGLSQDCFTLDINLGCSAFTNGTVLAANLIETGTCSKVLILIGDTLRRHVQEDDKGLTFIISDAGSATAVEKIPSGDNTDYNADRKMTFITKTDGSGKEALIIRDGVFTMDGMAVFSFAVKQVPKIIVSLLEKAEWEAEDISYCLLHQANEYMLKYIAKRAKMPLEKIPVNIGRYGNTNGSTIPFLLADLGAELNGRKVIMAGFGVGLSWAAIATDQIDLRYNEIITI